MLKPGRDVHGGLKLIPPLNQEPEYTSISPSLSLLFSIVVTQLSQVPERQTCLLL